MNKKLPSDHDETMAAAEQLFLEAYDRLAPKLLRHCLLRVKTLQDAQDLTSQTFTNTWDYLSNGNSIDNLDAFLYRTLHNCIVDYYRKKKEQLVPDEQQGIFETPLQPEILDALEQGEDKKIAWELLLQLDPEQQQLIILRYIEELSIKSIAKITRKSNISVRVTLHRAIKKARQIANKG